MNAKVPARIFIVLVGGTGLGLALHARVEDRREAGKAAFMTKQEETWDRIYNRPHHLAAEIFVCVAGTAALVVVYEIAAAGLDRVLGKAGSDAE